MKHWPALLMMLALAGTAGAAEPLEDATYEVTKICLVMVDCENSVGASPEHSAARKALIRMYDARAAFMRRCEEDRNSFLDCRAMADYQMLVGSNRAGSEYWKAKGFK